MSTEVTVKPSVDTSEFDPVVNSPSEPLDAPDPIATRLDTQAPEASLSPANGPPLESLQTISTEVILPENPKSSLQPTSPKDGAMGLSAVQAEASFDFQIFLDQMKSRSAEPVAKYLRSFLTNFSRKTFSANDQVKLVRDFMDFIGVRMQECEVWRQCSPAEFDNAQEAMEKLVMNRLYDYTFTPQTEAVGRPVTSDDLERDHVLHQRINLFNWIREEHLDIPTGEGSQGFISFAQKELLKINHFKAPRDKLICILNCCKVIFGLIRHLHKDESADVFIPLLILIVIRSNPDNLLSNVEYINRFRNPTKLQSEAGYYLSSLMGAVSFIETMDHSLLSNISKDDFENNVEKAIQNLPPLTPPPKAQAPRATHESSYDGDESAQPLGLPTRPQSSFGDDAKRFLQITGEAVSKPMNLIGKIFEALEVSEEPSRHLDHDERRPAGDSPQPLIATQYQPRVRRPSVSPRYGSPEPGLSAGTATPSYLQPSALSSRAQTPEALRRAPSPLDFAAMQHEIERAHEAASNAARETLLSIFPSVDREVADIVLESTNGDLGQSIDKLLEMGVGG